MRLVGALLVAGCAVVTGCSSETGTGDTYPSGGRKRAPIVLDENAVRAPRAVSDSAVVEDGQISLPKTKANEAWVAKLQPGNVIAGDRDKSAGDLSKSKNPYGFLRKVKSVRDGDPIVIVTEPAQLPDLLEGDLVFGKGGQRSIFDDGEVLVETQSLRPLSNEDEKQSGSGSGKASMTGSLSSDAGPEVRFSEGTFDLGANFEAELQIRKWWVIPTGVDKASAKLTLDPNASVILDIGGKASANGNGSLSKTWEGQSVPIPIAGPIPMTVRFRPEITCSVSLSGEVYVRGRAHLTGHAAAGFTYKDGEIHPDFETPSLSPGFELIGVQGKATLSGECVIKAVVSVLAFDAAGMEGKIGPYATVNAQVCATASQEGPEAGFVVSGEYGIKGDVVGRLQVPGLGQPKLERSIFEFAPLQSGPKYLVGDENTCKAPPQPDSCEGKADGLYCSEIAEGSAYECKDGQIAGGQQCLPPQKCKGPIQGKEIVCG